VVNAARLDDFDRRLLALLEADARAPLIELARRLKAPRSTVQDRLRRLEAQKIILGYSAVVATPNASASAVVLLAIAQRDQGRLVEALRKFPEIRECHSVSGEYDLQLTIEAPHLEDLDAVIDEIAGLEGVRRSQSFVRLARKFDRRP
jgi:DNA-binding Lrp family transcriptional regulator